MERKYGAWMTKRRNKKRNKKAAREEQT